MIKFTYLKQPPRRYTFEMPKLKRWVEKRCKGRVLNLFAGMTRLNVKETRVDINPDMIADCYIDAYEFVKNYKGKEFDTIILDSPYSYRKSMEKYNGHVVSKYQKLKKELSRILNSDGILIQFGYNTASTGKEYIKREICLICHNGAHHDTIALVEQKTNIISDYI